MEAQKLCLIFLILHMQIVVNAQEVIRNLDMKRYMGMWYEIASFPGLFQPKSLEDTRATYTLKTNGSFNVLNESWDKGKRVSIEGIAWKYNLQSDEAKFTVKFTALLSKIPVPEDYWILQVDENYEYALVGDPAKFFLWILSRKPQLDENIYNQLVVKAAEQDYDVRKLRKTTQSSTTGNHLAPSPQHEAPSPSPSPSPSPQSEAPSPQSEAPSPSPS